MLSDRREFLKQLAWTTGGTVLMPLVSSCASSSKGDTRTMPNASPNLEELPPPPLSKPADWDPIAYNLKRGMSGAIPSSYHEKVNGPDGESKHLGKHLPYLPKFDQSKVPDGFLAIMWGDEAKGHARHPNAVPGPDNNNEGHWYNWIRIRKAIDGSAVQLQSQYLQWPTRSNADTGQYAVLGGGELTDDSGKNTIYLAGLPKDLKSGDTIRIWAHCLTHGEYVDFITLP